jgi:transposase
MLYVGIDFHRNHLTVCARDDAGDVRLRRQVSTRPNAVKAFFAELANRDGGYCVVLEVCGFEMWLVRQLQADPGCAEVAIVHPQGRSRQKTDRRDANALSELLWSNRERVLSGQKLQGMRQVVIATPEQEQDRLLTSQRMRLGRQRTRTLNQIHYLLRRHNLEWSRPTKTFQTQAVRRWLKTLPLESLERMELNHLLAQWDLLEQQLSEVEQQIAERCRPQAAAMLLMSIRGMSYYSALALVSRIGDIRRFPSARSLANYFGLTPSSASTGETRRLGSITKTGSRHARFLLSQLVLHVLRKDGRMRAWFKRIKQRRGAKIARVAVMRRLTVVLWYMLSRGEPYQYGPAPEAPRSQAGRSRAARSQVGRSQAAEAAEAAPRRPPASSDKPRARGKPRGAEASTGSSSLNHVEGGVSCQG